MFCTTTPPSSSFVIFAAHRRRRRQVVRKSEAKQVSNSRGFGSERKETNWRCVEGCGACCKLAKGPAFTTPEEIFTDPSDIELYYSLIGPDGWCKHFNKTSRKCSIYPDRPYFCRVEPEIFNALYGIDDKKFDKEACSCCRDTIKSVYGYRSKELDNFNRNLSSSPPGYMTLKILAIQQIIGVDLCARKSVLVKVYCMHCDELWTHLLQQFAEVQSCFIDWQSIRIRLSSSLFGLLVKSPEFYQDRQAVAYAGSPLP